MSTEFIAKRGISLAKALVVPLLVVIVWWAATLREGTFLSPPGEMLTGLGSFVTSQEFRVGVVASLRRVLIAYVLASALGILLGVMIGLARHGDAVDSLLEILRPISPLAWVPMALLWFGISDAAMIFILSYATFFPVFVNTVAGIKGVSTVYKQAALTLGAKGHTVTREVLLPAALPRILTGLRLAMGLAWAVIVAAELAGGYSLRAGLGYLMCRYSMITFSMPRLVYIMVTISVLGYAADIVLRHVQNKMTPWRRGLELGR